MTNGHDLVFRVICNKEAMYTKFRSSFLKSQDADEAIYYTVHEPAQIEVHQL